jgi:hypothetical protein
MKTKKTKKEDFKTEVEEIIEPSQDLETSEIEIVEDYIPTPSEIEEFSEKEEETIEYPETEIMPEIEPEILPEIEPLPETPSMDDEIPSGDEPPKKTRKPYTKRNKSDLIDDIKKDYKPKDDGKGQVISVGTNKKKVDLSKYVSGTLLIMLIDSLIPNVMLYSAKYIAPEKYRNAKVESLQMTMEERKQIEPLANEVIVVLIGELSPLEAFLIFTAVIYGSKMLTL